MIIEIPVAKNSFPFTAGRSESWQGTDPHTAEMLIAAFSRGPSPIRTRVVPPSPSSRSHSSTPKTAVPSSNSNPAHRSP